jgi:hypothetical protein
MSEPVKSETAAVTAGNTEAKLALPKRRWLRPILAVLGVLFVINCALMWLWSREPQAFDVRANLPSKAPGTATVSALIKLNSIMLDKSGGYTSNDRFPPGVLLDNMPNFEFGMLQSARDLGLSLRNDLSRSQSQSKEDADLQEATTRLNSDNNSWLVPPSESQYRKANEYLASYLTRISDSAQPNAQFYARADNLAAYLRLVERQLGGLSQRLSAAVVHERVNTDLANDPNARQSTDAPSPMLIQTPWTQIDDNFYEARGTAFALIHILKAIQVDFQPVLANKNAEISLQQIIRELEETQSTVWSPMILNGGGFGFFANHSLVMANYVSRASAQVSELRTLLERG